MLLSLTDKELEVLTAALELFKDITEDTIFDDFPWNSNDIQKLSVQSDEVINNELVMARKNTIRRLDQLNKLNAILDKIKVSKGS